jgi:hypothetical protein
VEREKGFESAPDPGKTSTSEIACEPSQPSKATGDGSQRALTHAADEALRVAMHRALDAGLLDRVRALIDLLHR